FDDNCAIQGGVLEIGPIERDIVGNAVNDHTVAARVRHFHATQLHEFRLNTRHPQAVDSVYNCRRESVLHPEDDSNLLVHDRTPGSGRYPPGPENRELSTDRKSTRLNSSHQIISYAVFSLNKK